MYLEISPRGAGKTYRLIQAAQNWLNQSSENKAIIYCIAPERMKKLFPIKAEFLSYDSNALRGISPKVKRFFDDFDFFNDVLLELEIRETDFFVTSPAKIRTVEDIRTAKDANDDFLLKLLKLSGGEYTSFAPLHLWDIKLFKSAFSEENETLQEKQNRLLAIEREYNNRFYTLI